MLKKYNYVDLFAGAGGLSLGFEQAGFQGIFAVELDKWAAETYAANHKGIALLNRDIQSISDAEIMSLANVSVDVIVGGPPCQGFSGANTIKRDPKDPRNSLFQEYMRFAAALKPKICVVENVPGLLRTKLESGLQAIVAIEQAFLDVGYRSIWTVLNAANYGVPQKRERLFIVAIRQDLDNLNFSWPSPTHCPINSSGQLDLFQTQPSTQEYVSLWMAISDLPQVNFGEVLSNVPYRFPPDNQFQWAMRDREVQVLENHEPMKHTRRIVERFAAIGFGQSEADVPEHLRPRKRGNGGKVLGVTYDQNSRRQSPDQPCNAIVASSHTNFIHPFLNRNFTVREMMRIQSFPDWFVAKGKRAVLSKKLSAKKGYVGDVYLDQRAQIGNAVPPLLGQALAKAIWTFLESLQKEEKRAA